jgi:hypothetical protein
VLESTKARVAALLVQAASYLSALAVHIRNVGGRDWGWYSEDNQRCHIQTTDGRKPKIKFWLENKGQRCFDLAAESKGKLSSSQEKDLRKYLAEHQEEVEDAWAFYAVGKQWVRVGLTGHVATLLFYPSTHNEFRRQVDLYQEFPGWRGQPLYADVDQHSGSLRVGPQEDPFQRELLPVRRFMFQGNR